MTPLRVSVVMPSFRAGSTIDDALLSIADQTQPPHEVVVVDDASDDGTAERAERWSDRLPMVVIRRRTNIGCGGARRQAIEAATGDLIAPLDADDVWTSDHLATVIPLATDPLVIVGVRRLRWISGDDPAARCELWFPRPEREATEILRGNFLFYGSVAFRQTILDNGGWGPRRRVDDWDTWIRLIVGGGCRVVPAPRATVLYRTTPSSLSAADACLPAELALCESVLADPAYSRHRSVLRAASRRFRARQLLLSGFASSAAGRSGDARRAFVRAGLLDRSLHGGTHPAPMGSVTVRATAAFVAPTLAGRRRRELLEDKALAPSSPRPTTAATGCAGPLPDEGTSA